MKTTASEILEKWQSDVPKLRTEAPEVARAFGGLHMAAIKAGSLTVPEKELIAMAISLARGCTECICVHTEGALKAGATREQVVEAAGVAVMMAGGPAFIHMPVVLEALDHLQCA